MVCFNACFGSSKHRKPPKPKNITPSGDHQNLFQRREKCEPIQFHPTKPIDAAKTADSIKPISESKDKNEEQSDNSVRKKVTFDVSVKTHDEVIEEGEENGNQEVPINQSQTLSDSSVISYPPKHRYHNCTSSDDDEYEDMDLEDTDSNGDDDDNHTPVQEESSESLFSLSIESRKQVNTVEMGEKEVNSPMPIRISPEIEMNSVLNPVENLSQWKAVKARTTTPPPPPPPLKHEEKENFNFQQEPNIPFSEEPNFKWSNNNSKKDSCHLKHNDSEIAVDTSLSSWLVGSEKTPITKESPSPSSSKRFEDRPILGALTVEELKQLSAATSSPRRSPSRSPEEIPIIGTVGSYWSHTGQTVDSDSSSSCKRMSGTSRKLREDERVSCNSTPFAPRLERTLDSGIA